MTRIYIFSASGLCAGLPTYEMYFFDWDKAVQEGLDYLKTFQKIFEKEFHCNIDELTNMWLRDGYIGEMLSLQEDFVR